METRNARLQEAQQRRIRRRDDREVAAGLAASLGEDTPGAGERHLARDDDGARRLRQVEQLRDHVLAALLGHRVVAGQRRIERYPTALEAAPVAVLQEAVEHQ